MTTRPIRSRARRRSRKRIGGRRTKTRRKLQNHKAKATALRVKQTTRDQRYPNRPGQSNKVKRQTQTTRRPKASMSKSARTRRQSQARSRPAKTPEKEPGKRNRLKKTGTNKSTMTN